MKHIPLVLAIICAAGEMDQTHSWFAFGALYLSTIALAIYIMRSNATRMKGVCSLLLMLFLSVLCAQAQWQRQTNPPTDVLIEWYAATNNLAPITNYFVYYGAGSREYETKIWVGTNLSCHVYNLTRGTTYYFTVTSQDINGLESNFGTEMCYAPEYLPSPARIKSIVASQSWSSSPRSSTVLSEPELVTTNHCDDTASR